MVWVGVAAVTCSLTARGAAGIAGGALGIAFGSAGSATCWAPSTAPGSGSPAPGVWLSPIGWGQQTRPFGGSHWWPLAIALATFALLVTTAVALASRRDVGRGLWPERRGHGARGSHAC